MNHGTVYLLSNIELIERSIFSLGFKNYIIFDLDENKNYLEKYPEADCKVTVLLPPPSSVMKLVDGMVDQFIQEYQTYLNTNIEIEGIIELMIVSIFSDQNVFLYIPETGPDSIWINVLLEFIHKNFGLVVGTGPNYPFYIDSMFTPYINYILYKYNLVDLHTFILINMNIDIMVYIEKKDPIFMEYISRDITIATGIPPKNIGDIVNYVNWFKAQSQAQRFNTIRPMISYE